MSKIELPPLPTSYIRAYVPGSENLQAVEDLIRARDRQVLEVCAQIADQQAKSRIARAAQNNGRASDFAFGYVDGAENIAAAIRNLIEGANNG
jgi:hypothetical protein